MSENNSLQSPLLITRGAIVFPSTVANIDVGRDFSVSAINRAKDYFDSKIIVVSQSEIAINEPKIEQIQTVGSLCSIDAIKEINGIFRIRVTALERVLLTSINATTYNDAPTYECEYQSYPLKLDMTSEDENTLNQIVANVTNVTEPVLPRPVIYRIQKGMAVDDVTNQICNYLAMPFEKRYDLLKESSISKRLNILATMVNSTKISEKIENDINKVVRDKSEQQQKEYILREKMKAIQDELDHMDGEDQEDSMDTYLKNLEEKPYPESLKKKMKQEIKRFKQIPTASAEYGMTKAYIDTVMDLPWLEETQDNNDLVHAQTVLDEDHYGLEKVKERIIEYLAVKASTSSLKAPILCLYGPPGTGKTSLAKSIARALERKFVKASLGGTSDEAEIRGHRRTYVAAMPGKIIKGLQNAEVKNPVFLLDEIDKMASSIHGDPASAMLEVLDPEQNSFFSDNYIEEPFDLSKVLFIATANDLSKVPGPLRDRLELIELNTYTNEEKYHIAVEHLIPKQCKANGLDEKEIHFNDDALEYIIERYTKEAGVRSLERSIGTIIRKVLVNRLKNNDKKNVEVNIDLVKKYLGVEMFDTSTKEKEDQVGVVTGLAWTQMGGDTLPIESTYFDGKGGLVLTGSLGDVMKESASIALDYVKANAKKYEINPELFSKNDVHIHFPEGAVPKDGPSAGVAITVSLVSLFTNKKVSSSVAMTGEVSLRGNALAIGGLKEKTLAAYKAGIKKILIPKLNEKNMIDIPDVVKKNVEVKLYNNVDEALSEALV